MPQLSVLCAVRPGGQKRTTDKQMSASEMDWGGRTILDQRTLPVDSVLRTEEKEERDFP